MRRSADAGAASYLSFAQARKRQAFPPAEEGGSDVVFARICREGPVFWADELRW